MYMGSGVPSLGMMYTKDKLRTQDAWDIVIIEIGFLYSAVFLEMSGEASPTCS